METLIIILIVALIAQTCVFIYASFFDMSNNRANAANAESLCSAHKRYAQDIETYKHNLEVKDEILKQWIDKYNKCAFELDEARRVNGLLKNRTAYVEALKDCFNLEAETMWKSRGYIEEGDKERMRFVEGMKVGAEWLADCVGVKVEFEIDDRHKDL